MRPKTVEELDRRFDRGEDIFSLGFDPSKASRPGLESQRINIDVPTFMLRQLDHEAALRGITRQSLIKTWLYERLQNESPQPAIAKAIIGGSPEQMSEAVRQMQRAVEDVLEKHRTGRKTKSVRASEERKK
jgi:hypothetical protein